MRITKVLLLCLLFLACKHKPQVLPINKMKMVMWDMVSVDEWMKITASKDSTQLLKKQNISLYNKVFATHQITKEDFYNSYNYYQNHPNDMKILMDSLMSYGTKKRDTVVNHIPQAAIKKTK